MAKALFGRCDGEPVYEIALRSPSGVEAKILNWGAVIRDLVVPTAQGPQRVVLGLERLEDYVDHSPHLGAVAGRYANRIRNGTFSLDGITYQLDKNFLGKHCLHGGRAAFGARVWELSDWDDHSVTLILISRDGESGFPGTMTVCCRYELRDDFVLRAELTAVCDKPTPVNLALHSYFNLDGSETISDHELTIHSDMITVADEDRIPTGEVRSVQNTPHDFRLARPIGTRLSDGVDFTFDQNYLLREQAGSFREAAILRSRKNGLAMAVWTTEPCIQFYDSSHLNVPVSGLEGQILKPKTSVCLEPQNCPDSPNISHFLNSILRPGEIYRQITEYRFSHP
jgi:aldose 1-epimerase